MALTDDFDGIAPIPLSVSVTTADGAGTTVPLHGIENLTLPARDTKKDTYTPISGTRQGREQVLFCSAKAGEATATLVYEKAHQTAMDAITGTNGCEIEIVLPDDLTLTGYGGIEKTGIARCEDGKHMTVDVTIALSAGWTLA